MNLAPRHDFAGALVRYLSLRSITVALALSHAPTNIPPAPRSTRPGARGFTLLPVRDVRTLAGRSNLTHGG